MGDSRDQRAERLNAVGNAIRSKRHTLGLSQAACAELMGVAREDIARIEAGRHAIGIDRLWDLCDALDTTPAGLLAIAEEFESSDDEDD